MLREPLGFDDVIAVYVGLRPLLGGTAEETARLSRKHAVRRSAPGFVSVAGGKYTTYRLMARDAVDLAARELPFAVDASRSADTPLLGAVGLLGAEARLRSHPGAASLAPAELHHLVARHGTLASEVLDLVAEEEGLAARLPGAESYLSAEVSYAASHEGALHLDDVLTRRTHIAFEAPDRGLLAADRAAELMAPVLGLGQERRRARGHPLPGAARGGGRRPGPSHRCRLRLGTGRSARPAARAVRRPWGGVRQGQFATTTEPSSAGPRYVGSSAARRRPTSDRRTRAGEREQVGRAGRG